MTEQNLKYVLDANVFMEASRRYYQFEFAKPFWNGLISFSNDGVICSIDKVLEEIQRGDDELKTWAENEYSDHFITTKDDGILQAYSTLVNWAQGQTQYNQNAKDIFMEKDNADTWVLSFALSKKLIIVTHEVFDANIKKRIPIPNVCRNFDIDYCDTFELLRDLKFSF
jgi:hypothetical protein